MYIREIEIDNFKSFSGKITIPFFEGFTTISGPNGSGKSNIIDSVLFALGLSTSRTLRAEKLHQLITTHNNRNEAYVKITFSDVDNEQGLVIQRKIRKSPNGSIVSTYTLNEKTSTLSDIHNLLAGYNISPGSYNVIMQGDVTGIINTTPNERRKILDEIAGVADFDRRIDQATKELETVEQRVGKSNIILNEIDTRLSQLEEERSTALKYQGLKEEKQQLESKISLVKYFDIKTSIERLHESILDGNKTKKEQQERLNSLNKELEETRARLKEISDLVKTKGEDEQIEIKKQAEGLKGSISRKKDAIAYIDKQITDNKNGAKSSKENIERLNEKIEDALLRIQNKNDEIGSIEQNISREKEELDRILGEVSSMNKSTNEHVEKRSVLRRKLESLQDEENVVIKEILPADERLSRCLREIEESTTIIQNFENSKINYSSDKDRLSVHVEELSKELKDYEIVQKNTLYEYDKVKNELSDLHYNVNLAYRKITQLEANKRAIEDASFGRAIDTVMNSGLAGIHAPLAQLGQVDKEYSTAVEIAVGGRMKFIVVDTDQDASVAIEILKSSQAGRATFLPLNKIRSAPRDMRLPRDQGVVDFAINLIDFDEEYRPAFYHAVGDTLIVEDMNAARKLIGKYRMVTLDGALVEKTGAMTGGSVGRSHLKFSQSDNDELDVYKQRHRELEDKLERLERTKSGLENKLDKVRVDYSGTMNELNRKKIEFENFGRNLKDAEATIEARQKVLDENIPEVEKLEAQLIKLKDRQEKIQEEIKKTSAEIEVVESSIPKDELTKMNDLTESIEFEVRRHETSLANCRNDIKSINMEIDFNKESIKTHHERIEKLQNDNITLETEKEQHKEEIIDIEERLEELNGKIKQISSKLLELQQERDKVNQEVLNAEKRINILETKQERLVEQIEAYKTRRKELEPELVILKEELVKAGHNVSSLNKPDISTEEVNRSISRLQRKMEDLEPVNMKALVEYDQVLERKDELKNRLDTLSNERTQIIERMDGYEDLKRKSFMDTFEKVNNNFVDIFAKLSDGEGSLILENPQDPLNGGLTIEAQPRDKKKQRLEGMSGGEKSLTALAFVFAIQRYMPAPFYAFDEVDMHLDGINVEKLAAMITTHALSTQFIVVSLRKPMIESANRTVGVTQKQSGVTKVTGVMLKELAG